MLIEILLYLILGSQSDMILTNSKIFKTRSRVVTRTEHQKYNMNRMNFEKSKTETIETLNCIDSKP